MNQLEHKQKRLDEMRELVRGKKVPVMLKASIKCLEREIREIKRKIELLSNSKY